VFHIVINMLRHGGRDDEGAFWWTPDLLSYFVPHANSAFLYNDFWKNVSASRWFYPIPNCIEATMFMGYSILILSVLALVFRNKIGWNEEVKPLIFVSIFFIMMTMPVFKLHGIQLLNLPTGIVHFIPFVNND